MSPIKTGSTWFCLIPFPKAKLPIDRVQLDRDAFWARALIAYRQGFQWFSTEEEEAEIVARNAGYDIQAPWETPIGDYVRSRGTTPYIRIDEVYRELDIPAAQQTTTNANRIAECMASHGWIEARRRVGNRSTRVYAFFPDEVDKVPCGSTPRRRTSRSTAGVKATKRVAWPSWPDKRITPCSLTSLSFQLLEKEVRTGRTRRKPSYVTAVRAH